MTASPNSKTLSALTRHALLVGFLALMLYPVIWLAFASLKPNNEIFNSIRMLPSVAEWDNYTDGWNVIRGVSFLQFFYNNFVLIAGVLTGTFLSCSLTAFGFARLEFPLRRFFFTVLILTLLLPSTITLIPRYVLFSKLGLVDTYFPFWILSFFGVGIGGAYFIFLIVQFMRGIPRELDESAKLDGCSSFTIFLRIIVPLSKPVFFSVFIFAFIWTWNDFQNQLIFLNSLKRYTVALALRMTIDTTDYVDWGPKLSMALVSIIPSLLMFFLAQKYFVEGMSARSGLKG